MNETEPDLVATLANVVDLLEAAGIGYVLIGGVAKAAWGRARATRDIDIAVSADVATLEDLKARLGTQGFSVTDSVGGDAGDTRPDIFVARRGSGVPIDVLVAKTPFEQEAVARGVRVRLLGCTLRVATAEDLVFYKLLAGRPRDRDDVLDIVSTQLSATRPFDWEHLTRLAREWDVEATLEEIRHAAQQLLAERG